MSERVIVVGAGVGGLVSALLLSHQGYEVMVVDAAGRPGGKASIAEVDGCEFDTGPSLLTLPAVFERVFAEVEESFAEHVTLLRPEPVFRYHFSGGGELDVHHELVDTLASVRRTFGALAAEELERYLADARRIWETAAPHFVLSSAPALSRLVFSGLLRFSTLRSIDGMRSLSRAIDSRVRTPELKMILQRYATYNGSDVRRAPATLGCIAHVELELGGFGVKGGIYELVRALYSLASRRGAVFEWGTAVKGLGWDGRGINGVELADGRRLASRRVVVNADVEQTFERLLPSQLRRHAPRKCEPSMSAYNAVIRAHRQATRAAHAVLFPKDYLREFADIFSHGRVPEDPAVYLCSQERAHQRLGWQDHEPLFAMINAPASPGQHVDPELDPIRAARPRLVERGLLDRDDHGVWERSPSDLAQAFPGSGGALYGAASNDKWAAFRRAPNAFARVPGLFFASGSAHPGGGLPLVAQSGREAARAIVAAEGVS
ncbi:MAG TPA: phytoene desaturase family protein [Polyangiaceae bacterium]|nr:phytoene desaturase family protein [Polyangiaceae bacterium]